jgi:D-alanyl-D-alanine carboxypeptidase (penicillin-binding protein 5/6)
VPKPANSVYRRRRIAAFGTVLLVLAILFYLPLTLLAPLQQTPSVTTAYSAPTTTTPVLALPGYGDSAIAAVGYPGLLGTGGSSTPMPIASITKIITALVVLQKKPLAVGAAGPNIQFTSADLAIKNMYEARGGDVYPIQVGASMTEHQMLTVALVASANNYARALADWAYGSEANFLPVARAWLTAHGLTSTTLTDCTGLNPENTSTPTDLIALGKIALANPIIAPLVQTKAATLPIVGAIKNTNNLLGIAGIDGIKTGTLTKASLLFSSRLSLGGHVITLIGVVLDGPSHPVIDAAIHTLVEEARAGFHLVTVARKGQVFATYRTQWGTTASAIATRTVTTVVWGGTSIHSTISASSVGLDARGTVVGSVAFSTGTEQLTVPLTLSTSVADPGAGWRLSHPAQLL